MRHLLVAAAAALLFPMAASAQFSVGASLGYAIPMGDMAKDVPMTDLIKGAIPLEINAKYGVAQNLSVGAYAGYAKGLLNSDEADACDSVGVDCTVYTWGFGLLGEYGLGDMGGFVPFVGGRVGMAWQTEKVADGSEWLKMGVKGWEAGLQGGADMKVSEQLNVGAFIGFSVGQFNTGYVTFSDKALGTDDSGDITDKAMHEWLTIGVRGSFGL